MEFNLVGGSQQNNRVRLEQLLNFIALLWMMGLCENIVHSVNFLGIWLSDIHEM